MCRKNVDESLEDAIANQRDVDPMVKQRGAFLACQNNNSSKKWIAPPEGIIKLNADASLCNDGCNGLGVVARNREAEVIFCATRRVRAFWLPEIAECKALVMALRLGRRYGCANIIIEMDCKLLVDRLSKEAIYHTYLDSFAVGFFNSLLWSHVKRDGNCVAHHLASLVPFGVEQI
ncbi:hypothetical protein POM88_035802 [Heracleum sosnowskyi]|uniref:RNase H type-1 domain-containing protein n=1 Tax=Heracleum sosnowskyi TaxID=360622 RepID=A0AAD8HM01_9APIA|nr:hypothetical protein POM88_035802 [Heracleum sosnowskyi]